MLTYPGYLIPGPFHSLICPKRPVFQTLNRAAPSFLYVFSISKHQLLFLVVSLFCALVSADYTIDDSNYSVLKFSSNPGGPAWGPFGSGTGQILEVRLSNGTAQDVDPTQCYDDTYTYAACAAKDNCAVQFSFTGSGITIYVLRAGPQGMSASLSIDSGSATTATLDVPPAPQYYIPHAVFFNIQNIPSGTHSAVMTVEDWNGGFSGMILDYIDVNQAQVSGPTSSTPSPSPSPSSTPAQSSTQTTSQLMSSTETRTITVSLVSSFQSSGTAALPSSTSSGNSTGTAVSTSSTSKKTKLAAVVGGAIGGVGLLALLGLVFFCFRRRRQHMETLSLLLPPRAEGRFMDAGAISAPPFTGTISTDPSAAVLSSSRPSGSFRPLQPWTESETGSTSNPTNNPSSTTNFSHMPNVSSGRNSATSSAPLLLGVAAATAVAATTSAAIPQDQGPSTPTPPRQLAVRPGSGDGYPNEKTGPAPRGDAEQDLPTHPDVPGTRPNEVLTDNQADFVNSLFNNNVPAPVVARVLERMLANPQGANTTGYNDPELRPHLNSANWSTLTQGRASSGSTLWHAMMSDFGDGETTIGSAPPSYDFVQAMRERAR